MVSRIKNLKSCTKNHAAITHKFVSTSNKSGILFQISDSQYHSGVGFTFECLQFDTSYLMHDAKSNTILIFKNMIIIIYINSSTLCGKANGLDAFP